MSLIHYRDPGEPTAEITAGGQFDAGHDFRYTPYYGDEERTVLAGIWFWHPCTTEPPGARAPGTGFGPNGRTDEQWQYSNTDDPSKLTLTGSILCTACGFHGFLEDGHWRFA